MNNSAQKIENMKYDYKINSARGQSTGKICKNHKNKRALNSVAYTYPVQSQQSSRIPKMMEAGVKENYQQQLKDIKMLNLKLGSFAKN